MEHVAFGTNFKVERDGSLVLKTPLVGEAAWIFDRQKAAITTMGDIYYDAAGKMIPVPAMQLRHDHNAIE